MIRLLFAGLQALSAVLIVGLILVTVTDVVGRYLLNAPLVGAFELTQILLGALVFTALPLTTANGAHVEVDLLTHVLSNRLVRSFGIFAGIVSALVLVAFAWRLGIVTADQIEIGARTNALGVPLATIAGIGVASCLVSAGIAIAMIGVRR